VVGVDLRGAWGDTTAAGLEHFGKLVDAFEQKMKTLQSALEKYGLSWKDMGAEMKQFFSAKFATNLIDEFNVMIASGVSVEKVTRGMSGALSQYLIDAIDTGTKVPVAMQPILAKMIELGLITDEAARKMLGLAADTMPSLADISAAAGRYGLDLDALGPKVQQLQITEIAAQVVKDWKTLTSAGVDVGVILSSMDPKIKGMGAQVQELVNRAITYGLELPEAMRPILQAMIDAGSLTDDTGKKLGDLSKLTFAADLKLMFTDLMTKLGELIETIKTGVGPALTGIGNVQIPPVRIPYRYILEGEEAGGGFPGQEFVAGGVVRPIYAATGFAPRGTDTVPAMLTPGERVLTVAQNRAYERGTVAPLPASVRPLQITVISQIGRREFARSVVNLSPNEFELAGL
jgi:hypothetical protein